MKTSVSPPSLSDQRARRRPGGFTLPELMVAMTVFLLLVGGVVFSHLFGLRMFQITETKLSTTDEARKVIGRMADEIRSCRVTWVGNVKNGEFVAVLDGEAQRGGGLLIQPTTNAANFILYFVNPSDQTFRRTTSAKGNAVVLAESVTNQIVFNAQDFKGTVLTNSGNNRVVKMNLEFFQPARFLHVNDAYRIETAVTRRTID
jgi:prepilin-type N-terminal cleavage/methylation domain-containing protein